MWVDLLCCHNFGAQENTNRKEPERRKPSSTSTRFSSTAAGAAHSCVPTDILGNKHKATTLIPGISCLQRALPQPRSAAFLWLSDANFYFQPQIISSWSILTWFSSSIVLQLKEHFPWFVSGVGLFSLVLILLKWTSCALHQSVPRCHVNVLLCICYGWSS